MTNIEKKIIIALFEVIFCLLEFICGLILAKSMFATLPENISIILSTITIITWSLYRISNSMGITTKEFLYKIIKFNENYIPKFILSTNGLNLSYVIL